MSSLIRIPLLWFVLPVLYFASLPGFAQSGDAALAPARNQCRQGEVESKAPPFFISASADQKKNFEELRALAEAKQIAGYIPQNSIVQTHPDLQFPTVKLQAKPKPGVRAPANITKLTLIPVKVLSVPGAAAEQSAKEARDYLLSAKPKVSAQEQQPAKFANTQLVGPGARADVGTEGYVPMSALRSIGDFTFVVTEDSPYLRIPGTGASLEGRALRIARTADGDYCVNKFCTPDDDASKPVKCTTSYIFEVLSPDLQKVEHELEADTETLCCTLKNVRPIGDRQLPSLLAIKTLAEKAMGLGLSGLEMIDSMGLVKIPLKESGEGPFGSFHYSPDGGKQAKNWDALLNTTANCTFMKVLEEHQKKCTEAGCEIQWGDAFHLDGWGVHKGHDDGMCVDIRPLKTESNRDPVEWKRQKTAKPKKAKAAAKNSGPSEFYDLKKTAAFVELLKAAGGAPIFFNDPAIRGNDPKQTGVGPMPDHDNHIHVCFKADNPQVQRVCREGLGK